MKRRLTQVLFTMLVAAWMTPAFAVELKSEEAKVVPNATVNQLKTSIDPADQAKVNKALSEFKSLSKHERKARIKDAKKALKDYKSGKSAPSQEDPSTSTILLVILAILLPPVAVLVHQGELNSKFWIALLLTLLFYLPGLIYALIVIFGDN